MSTHNICFHGEIRKIFTGLSPLSRPMDPSNRLIVCWPMTFQPLWVILCCLPEKRRKEIEDIVEEMNERDREERGK